MTLTIPQRVIAEKLVFVNFVRTISDEDKQQHYYYIAVRAVHMQRFKEGIKKPDFDPEDYGFILESGIGEPDEGVKEKMWLQYGCNPENAIPLEVNDSE